MLKTTEVMVKQRLINDLDVAILLIISAVRTLAIQVCQETTIPNSSYRTICIWFQIAKLVEDVTVTISINFHWNFFHSLFYKDVNQNGVKT